MDQYLQDNFKFLVTNNSHLLSQKISYQIDFLNALTFNQSFLTIEKELNTLYEKIRVLEDVHNYLQTNIKQSIIEKSNTCEALLKDIETSKDLLKQNTSSTYVVPLIQNDVICKDRDQTIIPSVARINQSLTLSYRVEKNIHFAQGNKENNLLHPYNENLEDFMKNKTPYRTCYMLDTKPDAIYETLHFSLPNRETIQMIDATASNCDTEQTLLHHLNKNIHIDNFLFPPGFEVDSMTLTLKASNCQKRNYTYDAIRVQKDAFNQLAQNEINKLLGKETLTQLQINQILGIEQYNKDYKTYLSDLEAWKKKRDEVAAKNKKNGYTDTYKLESTNATELNISKLNPINVDTIVPTIAGFTDNHKDFGYTDYEYLDKIYPSYEKYRYMSID